MILENVPELFGIGYALIFLFVLFFLFKAQRFNKTFRYLFLIVTTGLGFLIFAPVLPIKFQNLLAMKPKGINPQYLILILGGSGFSRLDFLFRKNILRLPLSLWDDPGAGLPVTNQEVRDFQQKGGNRFTPCGIPRFFRLGDILLATAFRILWTTGILLLAGFFDLLLRLPGNGCNIDIRLQAVLPGDMPLRWLAFPGFGQEPI